MEFTLSDFTAGMVAGWASILIGQPFDLVKTYFQMDQIKLSLSGVIKKIKKDNNGRNITGLYKGASTMFIGTGFILSY